MTEFAQVDVKEVQTDVPRANFTEAEIEQLADLILASGGVIRPLVVKQVDIDRYDLLDGAFEYYGAMRAREKDPRQGELVNAFVVTAKTEATIQQQIEALGRDEPVSLASRLSLDNGETGDGKAEKPIDTPPTRDELSTFITNFVASSEARINAMREELLQTKLAQDSRIGQLEKTLAEKTENDLLETINTLPEAELMTQLSFYMDAAKAKAICAARATKADEHFQSYLDLLESTKGLGEKGLIGLIDKWQQMHA